MTRRELFRKTWRILSGDLVIWAMLEILFLGALLVVFVLTGSPIKVSAGGVCIMLLLPISFMLFEMLLYHRKLFLDLMFVSTQNFSGGVTRVSRTQNRRCDDYTFALYAEGQGGSQVFFLFGDLMKARYGELMQACSSRNSRFDPVSFCYLKRSKYIIELHEWPRQEEFDLQRKNHSKKWLKKQLRKQRWKDTGDQDIGSRTD